MQSKLQELTEKLYKDGVGKANEEADKIINDAKAKAEAILKDAQKEADTIVDAASKKSEEMKKNAESEIKLSVNQALSALKQEVVNLLSKSALSGDIKEAVADKDFVKKIIEITVTNWSKNKETTDLAVLLPEKDQKELEAYFGGKAKSTLGKGVEISFDSSVKSGFKIGPADGSFKISFSDEDFDAFFKAYLRPKTIELLYGGE